MQIESLLQAVKDGKIDIAEAKQMLARAPYEDLGFAKLDTHRSIRTGFAEVVYCQNKADDFLIKIFSNLYYTLLMKKIRTNDYQFSTNTPRPVEGDSQPTAI